MYPPYLLCLFFSFLNHCVLNGLFGQLPYKCSYVEHMPSSAVTLEKKTLYNTGSPEISRTTLYVQGPQSMHLYSLLCDMGIFIEGCSELQRQVSHCLLTFSLSLFIYWIWSSISSSIKRGKENKISYLLAH